MTVKTRKKRQQIKADSKLIKYWNQRYSLFSRFDDGIELDEESWYSVTPENIAKHHADRFYKSLGEGHSIIVDGFCGVGGNVIQFARSSSLVRVIGCDISQERIKMAKHNAKIYGVEHQCEFVLGDFMNMMQTFKCHRIDAAFLSPPWGGVNYTDTERYSLSSMTPNGYDIVHLCRKHLTDNIAFLMPRNVDLTEVRKKLLDRKYPMFECEQNMIGSKVKTITAYFGDLVDQSSETDSEYES